MFQHTNVSKDDTRKLIHTISLAINEEPRPEDQLDRVFEKWWPELETKIKALPPSAEKKDAKRTGDDIVAEVLELVVNSVFKAEANSTAQSFADRLLPGTTNLRFSPTSHACYGGGPPLASFRGNVRVFAVTFMDGETKNYEGTSLRLSKEGIVIRLGDLDFVKFKSSDVTEIKELFVP